jgi:hypothetical protein
VIKFPPERFWDACGATGPLHLDVVPPGGGEPTPRVLPRPFAVIGRDAAMDIALDHEAVSKRHAYLQVVRGRIFCVDLGSRTGVFGAGGLSSTSALF